MIECELFKLTESAMAELGLRISKRIKNNGAFIAMSGELGAGKTALTRDIANGLGIFEIISPTFTVVREHITADGKPFFHFDAYRLSDSSELYAIGFDDYLDRAKAGVIIMEWSENVQDALPYERLDISIFGSGSTPRNITIRAHGTYYEAMLEEFCIC